MNRRNTWINVARTVKNWVQEHEESDKRRNIQKYRGTEEGKDAQPDKLEPEFLKHCGRTEQIDRTLKGASVWQYKKCSTSILNRITDSYGALDGKEITAHFTHQDFLQICNYDNQENNQLMAI